MNRFGDGLVTLLMLAMGLGCLNVALQGLMDGSVGGAKSASFAFATKPVKFALIELIWVALGLVLLLGAWRGVSRQVADVDDEQVDDEELTGPARLSVEPLSVPSGVARTSSSGASRCLQPMPVAGVEHPRKNLASEVATAEPPVPLELYPSRFYAGMVLLLSTLFMISMAFPAVALTSALGEVWAILLLTPIALVYAKTVAQCWRNFFCTGPVLVLDQFGITDHRKGGRLIPWTEVDAVRLAVEKSSTYLMLRFRQPRDVDAHFGKLRWLQSIARHLFYKGFEGRVKLTSLVFTRSIVLQKARAFLRYSRR